MGIRVVVPVRTPPAPSADEVPRTLVRVSSWPDDVAVGLVDNGKGMAGEILVGLGTALVPGHQPFLLNKGTASRAMNAEQRAELLARSRLVLTGVGD